MTSAGQSVHRAAAEGFARGADTYARGRPGFPAAVQTWLRDELRLQPGRTVLDLGAGTGKFTVELVATGAKVFAVDPVAAMLDKLRVSAPSATALAGDAESIPVPDETCDAVVCAQSFHWFATRTALAEIRRVLKLGGALGLIWNVRDESVDWVAKLTRVIAPYEGDAPRMASGNWRRVFPAPGFGSAARVALPTWAHRAARASDRRSRGIDQFHCSAAVAAARSRAGRRARAHRGDTDARRREGSDIPIRYVRTLLRAAMNAARTAARRQRTHRRPSGVTAR